MSAFTLALAQYPIEPVASFTAWQERMTRWVEQAAQAGARLLVFPEYAGMELASLDPASMGDLQGTLRFVEGLVERIDAHHRALAMAQDVHILAGTMPYALPDGRVVNRARLFTPAGLCGHQDKIVMTRFEREDWNIDGGDTIRLFETALGRIGISICYDIEFPLIARAQAEAGAALILSPSCTDTMQGYWRVRIGAQARALENQCFVAQVPMVGMAPWSPVLDANYGAAALFAPPDGDSPDDGVLAIGKLGEPQWVYATVDPDRVTHWRREGTVRAFTHWPEQFVGSEAPPLACEVIELR
ncbi:MAG: amidohydrolase [Sphingobium sp. 66-54]|nr:MAG: amidohydrolase [Sphingobium sp. 66-54]